MVSAILYIYSTYHPRECTQPLFKHWYPTLLFVIHIYQLIEYLLRLYTAKYYLQTSFIVQNIYEIITIFPYLITVLFIKDPTHYAIFFSRMLDLIRIMSIRRLVRHVDDDINRELGFIIVGVSSLIIFFSGYIQLIENYYTYLDPEPAIDFFESLFFILTTISTIGYYSGILKYFIINFVFRCTIYCWKTKYYRLDSTRRYD